MVYLSWIEEYASGRFTQRDLFSTEAQNPVLFYLWFWILGMLSKLIGTLGAFHAGRVLGGAGLLLAVRWLLNLTLADEKARKLGYALTCFASGLGWIFGGFDPAKGFNGQPIDNFTPEAITFLSLGFSPLFAPMTALMVIFACGLLRAERTKKRVDLWPSAVAGAILGKLAHLRCRSVVSNGAFLAAVFGAPVGSGGMDAADSRRAGRPPDDGDQRLGFAYRPALSRPCLDERTDAHPAAMVGGFGLGNSLRAGINSDFSEE